MRRPRMRGHRVDKPGRITPARVECYRSEHSPGDRSFADEVYEQANRASADLAVSPGSAPVTIRQSRLRPGMKASLMQKARVKLFGGLKRLRVTGMVSDNALSLPPLIKRGYADGEASVRPLFRCRGHNKGGQLMKDLNDLLRSRVQDAEAALAALDAWLEPARVMHLPVLLAVQAAVELGGIAAQLTALADRLGSPVLDRQNHAAASRRPA